MHGTILVLFKRYVTATYDLAHWARFLQAAGVHEDAYEMQAVYPDAELMALAQAVMAHAQCSMGELQERFGEFLVPDLLQHYRDRIRPEWRTLDILEHTEYHMHRPVRAEAPGINPPVLHAERVSATQVRVQCRSERRMGQLAVGMVRGMIRYFGEQDTLVLTARVLDDGAHVEMLVERVMTPDHLPAAVEEEQDVG